MVVNRSAAPGPIVPVLVYPHVGEASAWLRGAFGFSERFRYGPDGDPQGAQLAVGEGSVFLNAPRTSEWADRTTFRPPRRGEASHSVHVHIADVDAHHQHAVHYGARILNPPTTYAFGERQYTAEDLAGHRWTFSQSVADVALEDWGGISPDPK